MIGNDIIDLQLAGQESRWQRKGFLNKLFTAHEQEMILQAAVPETMVWLLWSCKEAVYKIVNRRTQVRFYAPQRFICSLPEYDTTTAAGTCCYEGQRYSFSSFLTENSIHTIAVKYDSFFEHLTVSTEETAFGSIQKNQDGIPYLLTSSHAAIPVSVSHHGRYYGWVSFNNPGRSFIS